MTTSSSMVTSLKLDKVLAQMCVTAVNETLTNMLAMKVEFFDVRINEPHGLARGTISGIMPMVQGRTPEANMILTFSREAVSQIVQAVYGSDVSMNTDILRDSVSELCNMVYGSLKRQLNNTGHGYNPGIPTVAFGDEHTIGYASGGQAMTTIFKANGSSVVLMIHLTPPPYETEMSKQINKLHVQ